MSAPFDFTGKVVLVTGGSRGLGLAMARGFAEAGADLVITSRKGDACAAAAAEIEQLGRRAVPYACHVGHWAELEGLVQAAYDAFGRVDVLVNNAGIAPAATSSLEMTEELVDKTLAVNFKGPFRLTALVGHRMRAAGRGAIINVSSTGAVRAEPEYAAYSAAKAALNAVTRSFALELGPQVRVNTIMAGPFWTDISRAWREEADRTSSSAVRRIGRPQEIVGTALYLASDASSYTTGALITVDGGQR